MRLSFRPSSSLVLSLALALPFALAGCTDDENDVPLVNPSSTGGAAGAGAAGSAGTAGQGGAAGEGGAGEGGAAGDAGQAGAAGDAGNGGGGASGEAGNAGDAGSGGGGPPEPAALLYPTGRALFDKAIGPSCGAGPCHNGSWAEPDLSSYEALLKLLGAPCQTRAGHPSIVSNACEPPGDELLFEDGTARTILAVVVPENEPKVPGKVAVFLGGPPGDAVLAVRHGDGQERSMLGASLSALDESAWLLDLSGLPGAFADAWDVRDWPRPPGAVLEADPNGDGVLGAALGWRQVLPGDPARSYLYQRLLGDELGTQMPPIPTPAWPPEATRAAFCWVRGLEAPGATSPDAPIDFAGCPGAPKLAVQGCHERHDPAPRARCIPGPRGHRLGRRDPRPGRGRRHRPHRHR